MKLPLFTSLAASLIMLACCAGTSASPSPNEVEARGPNPDETTGWYYSNTNCQGAGTPVTNKNFYLGKMALNADLHVKAVKMKASFNIYADIGCKINGDHWDANRCGSYNGPLVQCVSI